VFNQNASCHFLLGRIVSEGGDGSTLKWVDWFNNRRLLEPIGYITPTEAEEAYYANMNALDKVA
jgi:hypothetical protein